LKLGVAEAGGAGLAAAEKTVLRDALGDDPELSVALLVNTPLANRVADRDDDAPRVELLLGKAD